MTYWEKFELNSYKGEILEGFYSYQAIVEDKFSVKNAALNTKLQGSLRADIHVYNVEFRNGASILINWYNHFVKLWWRPVEEPVSFSVFAKRKNLSSIISYSLVKRIGGILSVSNLLNHGIRLSIRSLYNKNM